MKKVWQMIIFTKFFEKHTLMGQVYKKMKFMYKNLWFKSSVKLL